MFTTSQINILDDNVLLDEYSIIVASDADGVETITAHDEEVDQITKLNLFFFNITSRYSKQKLHNLCTVHERESN